MKITDMNFLLLVFLAIIVLKNKKQLKMQNKKKYVQIKLSQNICQNDMINDDVIIKFSKCQNFLYFQFIMTRKYYI